MSGAERWQGDIVWKGRPLHVSEVRRLGRYARCQTGDGMLHEYDLDQFWVADLGAHDPVRKLHPDPDSVPIGPWFHGPVCDCGGCQPESA